MQTPNNNISLNPKLIIFFRKVWRVFFNLNFVVTFLLLYPLFYIFILSEKTWGIVFQLKRFWANLILLDTGITYHIKRESKLDKKGTYIFCANHMSYLDTVATYVAIPNYFHFIGKAELTKIPLFRIFFLKMDIPVNRGSRVDAHKAFSRAASDLKKGISIAIFPEGTIHDNAPKLNRFKNGPFKMAIESQVAIVPITFKNNWVILPEGRKGKKGGKPTKMEVVIHKPIPTKGMTESDIESLKAKVFEIIENELRKKK